MEKGLDTTLDTRSSWINSGLKKRMRYRDSLKAKAIKTENPKLWDAF